ncbi:Protein kinase superfamily protein [Pelomyxa schiedti]|nr:Protein kinase superfamily protein [Pelomyxa schiedti]
MEQQAANYIQEHIQRKNEHKLDESSLSFTTASAPAVTVESLFRRLTNFWDVPQEALLMCCILLDRATSPSPTKPPSVSRYIHSTAPTTGSASRHRLILTPLTVHKAAAAAVIVSTKYLVDGFCRHSGVAMALGLRPKELSRLEVQLLELIDYNLCIPTPIQPSLCHCDMTTVTSSCLTKLVGILSTPKDHNRTPTYQNGTPPSTTLSKPRTTAEVLPIVGQQPPSALGSASHNSSTVDAPQPQALELYTHNGDEAQAPCTKVARIHNGEESRRRQKDTRNHHRHEQLQQDQTMEPVPQNHLQLRTKHNSRELELSQQLQNLFPGLWVDPNTVSYTPKDVIGGGVFAVVLRGFLGEKQVALKVARGANKQVKKDFINEINVLRTLPHSSIVLLIGCTVKDGRATLILERMDSNLDIVIHQPFSTPIELNGYIPLLRKLDIALHVAIALELIHSKNIIHRDLKPGNILVDTKWHIKLADFGCARKIESGTAAPEEYLFGTWHYLAPEILSGKQVASKASDIYSFALVLWELYTEQELFYRTTDGELMEGIINNTIRPIIPDMVPHKRAPFQEDQKTPPGLKTLLTECWAGEPIKRPSILDVLCQLKALISSISAPVPVFNDEESPKKYT